MLAVVVVAKKKKKKKKKAENRRKKKMVVMVKEEEEEGTYTYIHTHTPQTFIAEFTVSAEYDHLQPPYISWHTCVVSMQCASLQWDCPCSCSIKNLINQCFMCSHFLPVDYT